MKDFNKMNDSEKILYFITWKHTGKMENMISVSTSVLKNPNCIKRMENKDCICSHCYAAAQLKRYSTQEEKLEKATEFFTSHIIKYEDIPYINAAYFRFEAFGDLNNEIQVINYFNIMKKNKHMHNGLFTKNPLIIANAMKKYGIEKPENLKIVLSSSMINKPLDFEVMKNIFPFIDIVFTVYTKEYIKENNININCGGLHCFTCLNCYDPNIDIHYINEELK